MSEGVLIALIAAGPGMVTAALGALSLVKVRRIRQDTAATRDQVENNHDTNLREEADERHEENAGLLRQLVTTVNGVVRDLGGIRAEIRALRDDDADQRERLHDLEVTQPKTQPKKGRHA